MNRYFATGLIALTIVLVFNSRDAVAGVVSYSGTVQSDPGVPVSNGFAIAGTFDPTFNPGFYKYEYGVDEGGNMEGSMYSQAVADGNFRPIGVGAFTDSNGAFSGNGFSSEPAGSQIFFFVFSGPNPDVAEKWGLASGSSSAFQLPDGLNQTTISTSLTTQALYVFGHKFSDAIVLQFGPIPEPLTFTLAVVVAILLAAWRVDRAAPLNQQRI